MSAPPQAVSFPHAAQLLVIDRSVRDLDGSCRSVEIAYGVTSLSPDQADPPGCWHWSAASGKSRTGCTGSAT